MAFPLLRGFSLIEVTVAVAIIALLALTTGILLQHLPRNERDIRDQDIALAVARSQIESLRAAGYDALPANSPFTSALLDSLTTGAASVTVTAVSPKTKQVAVQVTWQGADAVARSLSLTTLMTQNSGLP